MTKTSMALTELAEKSPDLDMLREMLEFATQRLMEFDAENRCGAAYGERGVPRANSRNGYRDRTWETRAGAIDLNPHPPDEFAKSMRSCSEFAIISK